jgi:hypothetical protein
MPLATGLPPYDRAVEGLSSSGSYDSPRCSQKIDSQFLKLCSRFLTYNTSEHALHPMRSTRSTCAAAALLFCGIAFTFFSSAQGSGSSAPPRSIEQQQQLCNFLYAQLNRSIDSFENDFGQITSRTERTVKLPSQINAYGRLIELQFSDHLTLTYLAIDKQQDQILGIETSNPETLKKLGVSVRHLRDVPNLYGNADSSDEKVSRYECDMYYEEFWRLSQNSVRLRIGAHVD